MRSCGVVTDLPFPMVCRAAEIGWTPLKPQAAMRKRGGEAGMLFRGASK